MLAVVLTDIAEWALDDVEIPEPAEGEVLIELRASSLNPSDWKLGDGWYRSFIEYEFPMRLGRDFSGVVKSVGVAATKFTPGDEVFGHIPVHLLGRRGTFAEHVVLPQESCMRIKPAQLSHEEAGVVPLAGMTALACLEFLDPEPGQRVLVSGAGGGVGNLLVQLLTARGATVIATALPEDTTHMRALGADVVIDYREGIAGELSALGGFDHLADLAGNDDAYGTLLGMLGDGGRVASALSRAGADRLPAGVAGLNIHTPHDVEQLGRLADMVIENDLRLPIERRCGLSDVPAALRTLRDNHVRGKVAVYI